MNKNTLLLCFVILITTGSLTGRIQNDNDLGPRRAGLKQAVNDIYFVSEFDYPKGFASVDTLEQDGTYGGQEGDTVYVTSGSQLFEILDARRDPHFDENHPPLVILIEGKLTWGLREVMDVKETYDLTILGRGDSAQIEEFGLNIYRSHNIIVKNIEFRNCHDDAINITDSLSHHVWVDHCSFSDDPESGLNDSNHDGLLDIKNGASFITVSWNHFYNHTKTCLLGASDNREAMDKGRLKVTYHHNWFDNTNQRHPRVRFGECHVFNNFYDNTQGLMSYGIASTMEADVVVEANYFLDLEDPTHVGQAASGPGDIVEFNNIYDNSGEPETRGDAFDPYKYYDYHPDDASLIPDLVRSFAGSGKLDTDPTGLAEESGFSVPDDITLLQNYPNPFNSETNIEYTIPNYGNNKSHLLESNIKIKIYDILGREIRTLVNDYKKPGRYSIEFNAYDLESGLYFCSLAFRGIRIINKMILLK